MKIIKKNTGILYDYVGIITLIFSLVFFCFMFYLTLFDIPFISFIFLIVFCFILRKVFIGLVYFIAEEEFCYKNKKIYYEKKLFKILIIKKLSFDISEIKKISNLEKKY